VLTGAIAIDAGDWQTCAVVTGGGVRCWGDNGDGQLGNGTTMNRSLTSGGDVLTGATAVTSGGLHTCALLGTGRLPCWGAGGAVGDGAGANPPRISAPASPAFSRVRLKTQSPSREVFKV
jgi:alpha-tubulin suppressor-like RCC1 family protein